MKPMVKGLEYFFTCTASPVQANGMIEGKEFYFRARYEGWFFSISEDPNFLPEEMDSSEHGFYIEGDYGNKPFEASYMPLEVARKIIENCARIYLEQKVDGI